MPASPRQAIGSVCLRVERFEKQDSSRDNVSADGADRLLLTIEEAASRLRVGRTTMFDLVRRGEVESVPIGRLRRIPSECLDEYVDRLRARADSDRRPSRP
jgi:excisionase family DNA binding protein